MRLPTLAPSSRVPGTRRVREATLLAWMLCATPALATHYLVDINGSGDFTTIQAAIDEQLVNFRDTILVLPGQYAETLALPQPTSGARCIVGAGGAAQTGALSLTVPDDTGQSSIGTYRIEGFTFSQDVTLEKHKWSRARIAHCTFLQRVTLSPLGADSWPNLFDCDFYGRTKLEWCLSVWDSLRFHSAPLTITHASGAGSFILRDCSFEGPADTLVFMPWANQDYGGFDRCTFTNALNGLVFGTDCHNIAFPVTSCVFRDLAHAGISYDDSTASWQGVRPADLVLLDSRFERCGTAVHWVAQLPPESGGGGVSMFRDTVVSSTGNGLVLGPAVGSHRTITDCVIEGSGGDGALLLGRPPVSYLTFSTYLVSRSKFANNRGDGLAIQDTFPSPASDPTWPAGWPTIVQSVFANNDGAGVRMSTPRWKIEGCVAVGNGQGFVWDVGTRWSRLVSNTSVLNRGEGFDGATGGSLDSVFHARNNLAVMNTGAGFRLPPGPAGSFAFNDAWGNYLAQYVGAWGSLDSNLTVDPRFCALGAGDLGLQQGSPCGAGGVYGLIGALPESCPNTTAVEPPAPGALAFAVRPSVARGSAEFVPPSAGAEGRVELFDLAGRVVWRAPLGPATGVVRWRGEGENGRVRAGLYWARFTRGSERATQRLVWLE